MGMTDEVTLYQATWNYQFKTLKHFVFGEPVFIRPAELGGIQQVSFMKLFIVLFQLGLLAFSSQLWAQTQRVVDIPTRTGVTQRMLVLAPGSPKAAVVLLAGGHGGLQISLNGSLKWGEGNFLVRTRQLFASNGLMVAVVDAPSDRQNSPYLGGFRQKPEHVADIKAVIAWLKQQANIPVWLVGTSRGTQSAAFIATQLASADGGPESVVLTSTILTETLVVLFRKCPWVESRFRHSSSITNRMGVRFANMVISRGLWTN